MSAPAELQDFVGEVAHDFPSAHIEFDPLLSGVCFLWVSLASRNFVIEYSPKQGTGVSENLPDTPPFIGHDEAFDSLTDGIARMRSMLVEAARSETAQAYVLHDKKK